MKAKFILILSVLCVGAVFADGRPKQRVIHGFDFTADSESYFAQNLKEDFVAGEASATLSQQLLIGHSMGGLIAMGTAGKVSGGGNDISGVITVNSPVTGFSGLDHGYDRMRTKLLDTIRVHTRATGAAMGSILPILDPIINVMGTRVGLNVVLWLCKDLEIPSLANIMVNHTSASRHTRLIRDMAPESEYLRNNVQYSSVERRRVQVGTRRVPVIKWVRRTSWPRIRVPVVRYRTVPVYTTKTFRNTHIKHRTDIPFGHVIGTENDPLKMAMSGESKVRSYLNGFQVGYTVGGALHTALSWVPFIGSYHRSRANRAFAGASWIRNYDKRWGDLIGSRANDGLIAERTQATHYALTVQGQPKWIVPFQIDHKRSTPGVDDPKTRELWGDRGIVDIVAENMDVKYVAD